MTFFNYLKDYKKGWAREFINLHYSKNNIVKIELIQIHCLLNLLVQQSTKKSTGKKADETKQRKVVAIIEVVEDIEVNNILPC